MKKTNVEMIKELHKYWEKEMKKGSINQGFARGEDVEKIKEICKVEEMDELELRNLRDTAVLFFSSKTSRRRDENDLEGYKCANDCMSALTHIVDGILREKE